MVDPTDAHVFFGGPLSNFARSRFTRPCPFGQGQITYATVEHFFQASKATTPTDHRNIAGQRTPRDAKRAGRAIELRADWEEVKFDVMLCGLRAKFAIPLFADALVATGSTTLAEDSPYDFEWGARDEAGGWDGQNLLGRALMLVRDELRTGALTPGAPRVGQLSLEV